MKLSAAQIAGVVHYASTGAGSSFAQALKTDTDAVTFIAIALAESGGETTATHKNSNGTTDYGLWQINSVHKQLLATGNWQNPNDNYHMATTLYSDAGQKFTPWASYNSGTYAPFLPEAQRAWGNPDISQADQNTLSNTVTGVGNAVTSLPDLWGVLTSSQTWIRVGTGAAGVVLLLMVFAAMGGASMIPGPIGMAAKLVKK